MEIPFLGGAYEGRSTSINAQQSINLFPVFDNNEAKNVIAMYGTPGTDLFSQPGVSGMVRCMQVMGDYLYVVIADTVYEVDSDGVGTSLGTITTSTGHVSMASNGNQVLIVDGTAYGYLITDHSMILISDSIEWIIRTSSIDNTWTSVTYGNGTFVAVAATGTGNRVMTSTNGAVWTTRTSAADNDWQGVAYGNGVYVAVSNTGVDNRVMTSINGITWNIRVSAANNNWTSVVYGNGVYVAVANSGTGNRVMTSSDDGVTWIIRTSATDNNWTSITYGNSLFVAVSNTGTGDRIMTSPDGITWTSRTNPVDNNWTSVTYGNEIFVAVSNTGTNDRVMTSTDGITWTSRTSVVDNNWNSVCYSDYFFMAVSDTGTNDRIMSSLDGTTWRSRVTPADNAWESIIFGTDSFVAVASTGSNNRVMSSIEGSIGFPTSTSCTFFDGYFIVSVLGSGRIQISGLYDGLAWDPLDFATAEASPDALVGAGSTTKNIWLFGETTTEVYYNSGNANFPFARVPGAILDIGCESLPTITKIEGALYWLSNKKTIVRSIGYAFEIISVPGIEYMISTYTTTNDAMGYTYTLEGRTFYVINFPSENQTFVVNIKDLYWHEWTSLLDI